MSNPLAKWTSKVILSRKKETPVMTLTKNRIIDSIYKNTDLMKSEAAQTFESLLEIVKQSLESGEDVLISGFGKFCVKEKKERKGRNVSWIPHNDWSNDFVIFGHLDLSSNLKVLDTCA